MIDTEAGVVRPSSARKATARARSHSDGRRRSSRCPSKRSRSRRLDEVLLDIAVGVGNVFAIVEAKRLGLEVRRELTKRIARQGMAVRDAINAQLKVEVPGIGEGERREHHHPRAAGKRRRFTERARLGTGPGRRGPLRLRHVCPDGALPSSGADDGRIDIHEPGTARVELHRAASRASPRLRDAARSFPR